jgi:DNA-binding NtrC family response regulator
MSAPRPRVSVVNSSEEIVLALRELLDEAGFDVSTGHVFDFKTGKQDIASFVQEWDPEVIVFDVAPPYDTNWHFLEHIRALGVMRDRSFVITSTNKKALMKIAGPGVGVTYEILGKPEDMCQIVEAVKRTFERRRAAA